MFSPSETAGFIRQWSSVAELPQVLVEAIELFDEARSVSEPAKGLDTDKITTKNVGATVAKLAADKAAQEHFFAAKKHVCDVLAGNVLRLAGEAIPGILEQLRPEFDSAAAEFAEAVEQLPRELTPAALVNAGPAALEAYQRAQTAEAVIAQVGGWLNSLHHVPGATTETSVFGLQVLAPRTRAEYSALQKAQANELGLNPGYVAAVRESIEFRLNTPAEQKLLRLAIESEPVPKRQYKVFN